MIDLIYEYKSSLKDLKTKKEIIKSIPEDKRTAQETYDLKMYGSMISDHELIIRWLVRGREPGAKRGLDRRSVYQNTVKSNNDTLSFFNNKRKELNQFDGKEVSVWDNERIEDALALLTVREKDVYLLHEVGVYSFMEIAEMMYIKKGTVQKHYERSKRKIEKRISESLFCLAE
ncbi:sigma factor-like helix-turn-helix DNA-binding protein [Halobacillus litoralis]|uniref:sigma factor-like helix-turn-helix DNA-binding protein n=1 Tax=Halobacillus litoralis TaxID=45668 RepID=UPI0013E8C16F|nr:sigma factor-like helix-turn-helix DNA-binding protein [Halobacillus litoralis]